MYECMSRSSAFWDMFHLVVLVEKVNAMGCDKGQEEIFRVCSVVVSFW